MEVIFSLQEINEAALKVVEQLGNNKVIALHGEMGAGKTTFTNSFCKALGVIDVVSSPTFSIINEYELPDGERVCHMDWYRLNGAAEAVQAGVEERIISGDRCWIEWPERAAELLPDDTWFITLRAEDADTRHIKTGNQSFS